MTTLDPDQGITLQVGGDPANYPSAQNSQFSGVLSRLNLRYASEAARTANHPVSAENEQSSLIAEDRVDIYDGANWVSLFHRSNFSVTRALNQTLTASSTVLQNVTGITVALPTAGRFHWRALVWASSPTTGDIKYAYTIPAGATMRWSVMGLEAAAGSTFTASSATASAAALAIGCLGAGTVTVTQIDGEITMGGTAGNLVLQSAQNTADPGVTNIALVKQWLWREA